MFDCAVFQCSTHVELWMSGELDFSQIQRVRAYWTKVQAFAPTAILLDLSAIRFIDGAGIRALVGCVRDAARLSQGFAIMTGGNALLPHLLERLDGRHSLPLYPTRTEALYTLARAERLQLPVQSPLTASAREADAIRWKGGRGSSLLQAPSALAERFLGDRLPERIPKPHPLADVIHQDDRDLVLGVHQQAENERRCFTVEYRATSREHGLLWLHDVTDGRRADGREAGRETVTTEITQQKREEEVRQLGEAIFRKILDLAPGEVLASGGAALSHFAQNLLSGYPAG